MLLFEIERYFGEEKIQPYLERMYKALFCLAYYGMMRVGELTSGPHTVKACDIHLGDKLDRILLVLFTSKTHGMESAPQKIRIKAMAMSRKDNKFFCPVKIVRRFMEARGAYKDTKEHLFIFKDGSNVKPEHFRSTLRSLLVKLNLNGDLHDVHSFRSDRTCDLAKFGYSIDQIKAMGHWRSNAVYKYLKN